MHTPITRPRRTLYPTAILDSEHCSVEHVAFLLPNDAKGTTSLMERFQWPELGWNKMSGADQDRLVRNLKRILCNGNMSGFSEATLMFYYVTKMLRDKLAIEVGNIRYFRSCGILESRRTVLKN